MFPFSLTYSNFSKSSQIFVFGCSIIVLPVAGWAGDDNNCGRQLGLAPTHPKQRDVSGS